MAIAFSSYSDNIKILLTSHFFNEYKKSLPSEYGDIITNILFESILLLVKLFDK